MKTSFIAFLLFLSFQTTAQVTTKTVESPSNLKAVNSQTTVYQIDSAKYALKNNYRFEAPKDVAYYDYYISALETKINFVSNDPVQKAEAENNGWFDQMNTYLDQAKKEREALLEQK